MHTSDLLGSIFSWLRRNHDPRDRRHSRVRLPVALDRRDLDALRPRSPLEPGSVLEREYDPLVVERVCSNEPEHISVHGWATMSTTALHAAGVAKSPPLDVVLQLRLADEWRILAAPLQHLGTQRPLQMHTVQRVDDDGMLVTRSIRLGVDGRLLLAARLD